MRAGIAFSNTAAAFSAGQYLAREAISQAGGNDIEVLLLFCNANTNYQVLLQGARAICGADTLILGGSAVGIITNKTTCFQGYPAAALALSGDKSVSIQHAFSNILARDPHLAGLQLSQQLKPLSDAALLLLFYDSVRYAGSLHSPAVLTPSPPLLESLYQSFPQNVPIVGAGLLADLQFSPATLFYQHQACSQVATALMLSGDIKPYISATHGCIPIDSESLKITSIFQQFLYKINNKPAPQILDQISGNRNWRHQSPVTRLAIGAYYPTLKNPYSTPYISRLINGALPNDEGIILFEPDLHEGMEIRLMQRDTASILHSTNSQTERLIKQIEQDQHLPVVALYFDCAGRIHDNEQEAKLIQQHLNQANIPLLGIYTGVEIAPVGDRSRSLDWSGVLVILTKPKTNQQGKTEI